MDEHIETNENRHTVTPIPPAHSDSLPVDVWECKSGSCKGWMRKSFSLDSSPVCPLCKYSMKSGIRTLSPVKKEFRRTGINFARKNRH